MEIYSLITFAALALIVAQALLIEIFKGSTTFSGWLAKLVTVAISLSVFGLLVNIIIEKVQTCVL